MPVPMVAHPTIPPMMYIVLDSSAAEVSSFGESVPLNTTSITSPCVLRDAAEPLMSNFQTLPGRSVSRPLVMVKDVGCDVFPVMGNGMTLVPGLSLYIPSAAKRFVAVDAPSITTISTAETLMLAACVSPVNLNVASMSPAATAEVSLP